MYYLLKASLFLLLWTSHNNIVAEAFDLQSIKDDLSKYNKSCSIDNCESYEVDSLSSRACHCGTHCVHLGTCCFDSPYADVPQPVLELVCKSVHKGFSYFMVEHCLSSDSVWADLCNEEVNADDDLQQIVPVTSVLTSKTYKNYYCFMCHEGHDEFLYWTLKVKSKYSLQDDTKDEYGELDQNISFIYDKKTDRVMATNGDHDNDTGYFLVESSLEIPSEIENVTYVCEPDVISNCSDEWSDEDVRNKCRSYTAIKYLYRDDASSVMYKNIHCALCNGESVDDVSCKPKIFISKFGNKFGGGYGTRRRPGSGYNRFTFTYLLDINRSDGELVGKIQKCSEDHKWDPFAKKCRKLSCALPGFEVKGDKCVKQ